jgi:glycosyltransferase involved in cell wall biosynthesis
MIHTNAERESFEINLPYLTAVHDWTHRTHPHFNEFTADGVYEQREYIIANTVKNAECILVDSETAKVEIRTYYDMQEDKLQILPFVPPPYLLESCDPASVPDVKKLYALPDSFIFYPAQFWPHKNHENILKALSWLNREKSVKISAVFVGSTSHKWSSFDQVMSLAKQLNLENQVFHFGYVPPAHIKPLYQSALALVIPTFPGPTNIPVLEAFATGCPVIASNHKALQEQVADAGLLVDPHRPEEIGAAIFNIFSDPGLRSLLIEKGRKKIEQWGPPNFCKCFYDILEETKRRLSFSRK